jgi:phosphodiesterase/alkaline phosphatase D-like protein
MDNGVTWGSVAQIGPTLRVFDDTSCAPLTQYWYRVIAQNAQGPGAASNTVTATTPATPVGLPSAPIISRAARASSTSVVVQWALGGLNDTGIDVEYSPDRIAWTLAGTTAVNGTAFTVTALVPKQTYYFRARAKNSAGNSPYSGIVSATTTLVCRFDQFPACQ